MVMEWVKTVYGAFGAPYPAISLIVAAVIGALLVGGSWYAIGKQYDKDQAMMPPTGLAGHDSVSSSNQSGGITARTINIKGSIYNAAPNLGNQTVNNYAPPARHITQKQLETLNAAMPKGEGKKIGIRLQDGSNEGRTYANEVRNLFQQAGWDVILTDAANTLPNNYRDLVIEVGNPEPEAIRPIAHAFNQAGVKFHTIRGPWATGTTDAWRIVIWPASE